MDGMYGIPCDDLVYTQKYVRDDKRFFTSLSKSMKKNHFQSMAFHNLINKLK